jgi:hypothetical protein
MSIRLEGMAYMALRIPSRHIWRKTMAHPSEIKALPSMQAAQSPKITAVLAGWIVLVFGLVVSLIPLVGLSMIFISIPVCFASLVLGIVGAATGRPVGGVVLIVSSILAFFVFQIIPWISSLIGLAAAS